MVRTHDERRLNEDEQMTTTMRKIVKIDEDKCNGCGLCVPNCAEGAIRIIDGKARLIGENLCDGLGACLGKCPLDAITIEQRPAEEFDEEAVERHRQPGPAGPPAAMQSGCPGMVLRKLRAKPSTAARSAHGEGQAPVARRSALSQWPVQLALLPARGDVWDDADVLIAADCVAAAMPDFHERLLSGKTLAVACPKLDDFQAHVRKLSEVFASNRIRSIIVAHMEVPCCAGIVAAVEQALDSAGRDDIPVEDVTIGIDGQIIEN
jgi:ferredoxin